MRHIQDPPPDYTKGGYAEAWGYRTGSGVARLVEYLREEYRAKYGCDYRLYRTGKNKFRAVSAVPTRYSSGTYGIPYAVENATKFGTTVTV